MKTYIILLRGINVGGKNKIPMLELKKCLEDLGFSNVITYIASGNVILKSDQAPTKIKIEIEKALPTNFKLNSELIKILVLSPHQLQNIIDNKPPGFGEQPQKYHSDVIFLMDIDATKAMQVFDPREGVDKIWPGKIAIYSQRLSEKRTQSRLNKIMGTAAYKSMTIRNWNTVQKMADLSIAKQN